jgi:hypothetical protein
MFFLQIIEHENMQVTETSAAADTAAGSFDGYRIVQT